MMDRNIKRTHEAAGDRGTLVRPTPNWPADRSRALIGLWNAGHSAARIAALLRATTRAVESKVRKLRVAGHALAPRRPVRTRRPRHTPRTCLYCGDKFASSHVGNRLCPGCLETGPFTSPMV